MSFLDREATVAPPGYNRWLVPPAALAIHLSIGQVYAWSVFKTPLNTLFGHDKQGAGDWSLTQIAITFSIAIVFLGMAAAIFGKWVERSGPRKTMLASACCFGGGFLVAALGIHLHQIWLLYLGYGAIGGCGLGLGYIAPVSTLVKWFPDRPGTATGLAIMGFGGGALIGSNLSRLLLVHFKDAAPNGVAPTFIALGVIYFVFILFGALIVRVPAEGWKPAGYDPAAAKKQTLVTTHQVALDQAWRTPQFWLLWVVLCFNVTAGIGLLEDAAVTIKSIFPTGITVPAATAYVGLLSLFNMGGRFVWSSFSDIIGRKNVYIVYLLLGACIYTALPTAGRQARPLFFVALTLVAISMYGGGFATIPAYLKDLFGTYQVGAIHGRLLTAWSVAGVAGPLLVNKIRDHLKAQGAQGMEIYAPTLYLMSGLLVVGLICNLLVTPVGERFWRRDDGGAAGVK